VLRESARLGPLPRHLPGPRVEPVGGAVLPGLPVALIRTTHQRFPAWVKAAALPWLPIAAVLFFFTVPRREVLVRDAGGSRLEISQGFRTRIVPVRDVRIEPDADTKRPSLVVETTMNVEHFGEIPDLKADGATELLGPAWLRLFGGLIAAEVLLVVYFVLAQREITIDLDPETGRARVVERGLLSRPRETKLELDEGADARAALDAYRALR
jgi:hypothetical protein